MREFFLFEAAALLLCWFALLLITECPTSAVLLRELVVSVQQALGKPTLSGAVLEQYRVADDALPDELLALFWLRRAATQPYATWYLHSSSTYPGVDAAMRLPKSVVAEGQILYPVHVIYLYLSGLWLRLVRPDLAATLLSPQRQPRLTNADAAELRQTLAWMGIACVVLIGAPAVWCLVSRLTSLLRCAVRERESASRLRLPADVCAAVAASAVGATTTTAAAARAAAGVKSERLAGLGARETSAVATFLGSLIVVLMGMVPLMVMEVCTMQPWCLCGSLLVWAVYWVLANELQLHASESDMTDDAFDLATPVVVEGAVQFFTMRQAPRTYPLMALSLSTTVMALASPSCLFAVPLLVLWVLSACWQHGHRRVLATMKVAAGARAESADRHGYVRLGYSRYCDKLWMNTCFSGATVCSACLVLLVTTPWWYHQQSVLSFMDLFASPPLPATAAASALSFTGGREMVARCLRGPYTHYTCAQPTPNMWRLTEWFGMPWTGLAKSLTRLFTLDRDYVNKESPLWLKYIMIVLLVLVNGGGILVLALYRIRAPPLAFETPAQYATLRAEHDAERQAYWETRRGAARRGGRGAQPPGSGSAAEPMKKRAVTATCVSREEYVVKQVVLVCWMLCIATTSGTVLFLRTVPSSCALTFPCSALLAAVYVLIRVLRRDLPLAFHPIAVPPPRAGGPAAAAGAAEAAGNAEAHDASALVHLDRGDPQPPAASRWCTTAVAPSLAHVADVAWLYLVFTATALGTGALTWMTVPVLLRHGVLLLLCGCIAVSLLLLRRWARVDTTSNIFFKLGSLGNGLLALVLAAQAVPQTAASAAARQPVRLTDFAGDVYGTADDNTLRALVYQGVAACVLYACCIVHGTLRLARLALEPEEVRLVPIEEELRYLNSGTTTAAGAAGASAAPSAAAAGAGAPGAQKKRQ
ncbi:hypothetical protein NESM_000251300 [Novymonas esmeraldas]|uniref:Uncharacterized protein n=1 Tax=Novymonas esmeraldas TaxID=1808958 RepID=A0AAW0F5H9_9TRYP